MRAARPRSHSRPTDLTPVLSTTLLTLVAALGAAGAAAAPTDMEARNSPVTEPPKTVDPTIVRNPLDLSQYKPIKQIQLGPRPYYLVDNMVDSPLKRKLQKCENKPMRKSTFSIGHRGGGTLQIPEHTLESNLAGARMGAGILECDVAFTKDRQLVCRHSQCDLHTTTNVVAIPAMNAKCSTPFVPANGTAPAKAKCCTSDFTLAEIQSLCGKMDAFNASATTPEAYLGGILPWRTSLYEQCGTILSLKEHIELTTRLGLEHTPELKTPEVPMPFEGDYTQEKYAQQMVDTYRDAKVDFKKIWPQSFLYTDMLYWIKNEPKFAEQATYLDDTGNTPKDLEEATRSLRIYKKDGIKYISPPLQYLLTAKDGQVVPSPYAEEAMRLGFGIVSWSLERSGPLAAAAKAEDWYVSNFAKALTRDGDMFTVVDVLVQKIGVRKLFSDWTATTTYYANCMGIF